MPLHTENVTEPWKQPAASRAPREAWVQGAALPLTGSGTTHSPCLKGGGTKASLTDPVRPNWHAWVNGAWQPRTHTTQGWRGGHVYAAFHVECMTGVCQAGLEGILRDHTKPRPGLSPWAARRNGLEALREPRCPGPVSTGLQWSCPVPWPPCALHAATKPWQGALGPLGTRASSSGHSCRRWGCVAFTGLQLRVPPRPLAPLVCVSLGDSYRWGFY